MPKAETVRSIYEAICVLLITSAGALFFSFATSFSIYASGVPGGRDTQLFFYPTPFLFVCFYAMLARFTRLRHSTGPWTLMITMCAGISFQFVLSGIVFVYYRGLDQFFISMFPGYFTILTSLLIYIVIAAALGVVFWLPEKIVQYVGGRLR